MFLFFIILLPEAGVAGVAGYAAKIYGVSST